MVTDVPGFDHRDAGTAEAVWADSPVLRSAVPLQLADFHRLVVVAAHPDDESLGAGGLLATATRLGIESVVIIATMGEQSHPDSPTHTQSRLASRRRAEVVAALELLAPTAIIWLPGFRDGELSRHETELSELVGRFIDGATLVAAPWTGDGHPDHAAAGHAAAAAVDRAAAAAHAPWGAELVWYPIWAWHWGRPDDLPAGILRLDLEPDAQLAKHSALQCHQSQVQPLSEFPGDAAIIAGEFAEHFERPYEIFLSPGPASIKMAREDESAATRPGKDRAVQPSLRKEFFDEFYGDQDDPWGFETRWYETRKRAITMASLPRQSFRSAFEPGCSIGVLTEQLADRCDRLLATDISERPLAAARGRLAGVAGVRFEQRRIPVDWPGGEFDLIVLSEIGYYCDVEDLDLLVGRSSSSLVPDGVLLACHWRHPVAEYPLRGDDVHRALSAEPSLALLAEHVEEDFILQVFTRAPVVSVARATGLLS